MTTRILRAIDLASGHPFRAEVVGIACLGALLGWGSPVHSQNDSSRPAAAQKQNIMMTHARGTFDVKLNPLPAYDTAGGSPLGRMSIDKQFHGDLEATSKGEMLTGGTDVKGSAGYVAIERVTGTLQGRNGSFILQHSGTMTRGEPQLTITVVPDSGTGQLAGLAGKMSITIADGKHSYAFDFTLSKTP